MTQADVDELRDLVADAFAGGRSLEIVGGGSKRSLGRPSQADDRVSLEALAG